MKQGLGALLAGLIGGAIAAFVVPYVIQPGGDGASGTSGAEIRGDPAVLERLDRLEQLLERGDPLTARLEGRPGVAEALADQANLATLDAGITKRMDELFSETIEPKIETVVKEKWDALQAEKDAPRGRGGRKRMKLADVAREVGLSAGEEDDLRRIFTDAENKMYDLFAKPDGDAQQVKADLEAFKTDKTQRPKLIGKYMPKMIQNMGEMMAIEQAKNDAVVEAVGVERAAELGGYSIEEASPFDMNAEMRVEAGSGR